MKLLPEQNCDGSDGVMFMQQQAKGNRELSEKRKNRYGQEDQ